MSIPWPKSAPSSKAAIEELMQLFDNTPEIIVAWHTLVGDLLQSRLTYFKSGEAAPVGFDTFVADAVKSIMITGVFFWKKRNQELVVAHPLETWLDENRREWNLVVLFPPTELNTSAKTHIAESHDATNPIAQFTSPVQMVRDVATQLNKHRKLFLDRDILNSRPACFVQVSPTLQNNGHPKPWFRSVQNNEYLDNFEEDLNQGGDDVQRLIRDRVTVINELGSSTEGIRKKRRIETNEIPQVQVDSQHREHAEHIVTDGFEARETRSLQSLSDNLNFVQRLQQLLLQMLKVPPAAIGSNINTERLASSSQLVARSLLGYHAYVKQLQKIVAKVFQEAGESEGDYVHFKRTLTAFQLQQVAPYLKQEKYLECTALAYNIPEEWFDISKFENADPDVAAITQRGHHPEQNDINKEKRESAPPTKAETTV